MKTGHSFAGTNSSYGPKEGPKGPRIICTLWVHVGLSFDFCTLWNLHCAQSGPCMGLNFSTVWVSVWAQVGSRSESRIANVAIANSSKGSFPMDPHSPALQWGAPLLLTSLQKVSLRPPWAQMVPEPSLAWDLLEPNMGFQEIEHRQ